MTHLLGLSIPARYGTDTQFRPACAAPCTRRSSGSNVTSSMPVVYPTIAVTSAHQYDLVPSSIVCTECKQANEPLPARWPFRNVALLPRCDVGRLNLDASITHVDSQDDLARCYRLTRYGDLIPVHNDGCGCFVSWAVSSAPDLQRNRIGSAIG